MKARTKIYVSIILGICYLFCLGEYNPKLYAADPPPTAKFIVRANTPSIFNTATDQKIAIPYNVFWNDDADPWVTYFAIAYLKINYDPNTLEFLGVCKGFIPASVQSQGTNPDGTAYVVLSLWWFNPKSPKRSPWDLAFMPLFRGKANALTAISHEHYSWAGWRTYSVHGFKVIPSFFKTMKPDEILSSNVDVNNMMAVASVMPQYVEMGQSYWINTYTCLIDFPIVGDAPPQPLEENGEWYLVITRNGETLYHDYYTGAYLFSTYEGSTTPEHPVPPAEDTTTTVTHTPTGHSASTSTSQTGGTAPSVPANNPSSDADPIYTHDGEFYQNVTDLTIPGRGFPFTFKRSYRSGLMYNGPLGWNWEFNYNKRLWEDPAGNVVYFDGEGHSRVFTKVDGGYDAPTGLYKTLTKHSDWTYTLRERNGTQYHFNWCGQLEWIRDRNNNVMSFYYNIYNQLVRVRDTLGRDVVFSYQGTRLHQIKDWANRTVTFGYGPNGDLVSVTSPITDDYPLGKTTQYTYSSVYGNIQLNHNLLTITDPKGQEYLENKYNNDDRVYEQRYGEGSYKVSYEEQPGGILKTTIIDRNNNTRIWYHNTLGNAIRKEVYTDGGIITTNLEHNADGERSRTIFPESNSIEYTFDSTNPNRLSQGNLLEVRRKSHLSEPDIVTTFSYEPLYNQVKTSTDARNNTTTFYFDAQGNVNRILYPTVTLPDGSPQIVESNFQYNTYGQVVQATDPEGIITAYEYYASGSPAGYLWKVIKDFNGTDPATQNTTTEYNYDIVGNVTGIRDAKLNWTIFEVNNLNQVTKTISRPPFNYEVKFFYDENDNLKEIWKQNIDENGQAGNPEWIKVVYDYDTLDNLKLKNEWISATELPVITQYKRDDNENLTDTIQPENNIRKIIYDELDRVYQSIEGFGSDKPLVRKNSYDGNNKLMRTEIGNGAKGTIFYQHDGFDRRKLVTNVLGDYTIADYDNSNNIIRSAHYNNGNQKLNETLYSYDELNRMYKTVQKKFDAIDGLETNVITTYWYDKKRRKWKTVDAKGNATITVFDNLDRVKSTTDALSNKIEYRYDSNSNVTVVTETEKDSLGNTVTFVTTNDYDNLDRRIWTRDNLCNYTYYAYDSRNNLKRTTDRENHITRRNYDGLNRLREVLYELTPSKTISTKYGLDKNGRLVTLTDDNTNITTYGYDAVNRRNSETFMDNSQRTYQFGQYGELDKITDQNGNIINHTYDNALRLTRKDITKGSGVDGTTFENFGYDNLDRMTMVQNDFSTVTMNYDSLDDLLSETQQIGSQPVKSVTSVYNELGFRTSLTYPNGRTINFEPDELSRIRRITQDAQLLTQYSYVGPTRVKEKTYLNGTKLTAAYDGNRRITNYSHSAISNPQSLIAGFEYTFDRENNKLYEKRLLDNEGDAYVYDAIYRLTGVKYGVPNLSPSIAYADYLTFDKKEEFDLDGVGNRITVSNDTTVAYTTNELNQYTQINSQLLSYDLNGNLKDDGTNTYIYDYANRLVRVIRNADNQVIGEYKYDALGRRVEKTVRVITGKVPPGLLNAQEKIGTGNGKGQGRENGKGTSNALDNITQHLQKYIKTVTTQFYYDGVRVIEERDGPDTLLSQYVFGNGIDEVLTMERNNQTYYYHDNTLGSIYALTDNNGEVIERYNYTAYGQVTITDAQGNAYSISQISNRFMFTGREYDAETGLYYYRARYYSAELGRFINRDPAEDDRLFNLYTYANSNPLKYKDPWGQRPNYDEALKTARDEVETEKPSVSGGPQWVLQSFEEINQWILIRVEYGDWEADTYCRRRKVTSSYAVIEGYRFVFTRLTEISRDKGIKRYTLETRTTEIWDTTPSRTLTLIDWEEEECYRPPPSSPLPPSWFEPPPPEMAEYPYSPSKPTMLYAGLTLKSYIPTLLSPTDKLISLRILKKKK